MDTLPTTPEEHRLWWEANTDIPYGFCQCGCGEKTKIARQTSAKNGTIKGEPNHYLKAHYFRTRTRYVEEDRGYDTPCWIWQLKISQTNGYGHVNAGGKDFLAHRYYYEQHKGPIPAGLTIDHLCRVRECVNPDHLEAVPMHINQRRGSRTILSVEMAEALKEAHALGVQFPILETLTGIKRRTLIAAVYEENWSKP